MTIGWWVYGGVLGGSALLSALLTPLALRAATRARVLDLPTVGKRHREPTPYLGGVAIVVAFSAGVLAAASVIPVSVLGELAALLGAGLAIALIGLFDDLWGMPIWLRVAVQVAAALAAWFAGTGILLFRAEIANLLATVGWIVVVTNAFNLLDNMDGLSAGIAGIASAAFLLIAAINGQYLVAALAAALTGCTLGFLSHNFHPARIYMGDAGSLFLGFLLAVLGIKLRFDAPTQVTFIVPVLVVGVALFDTALVVVTRLLRGQSALRGGQDHTSHRLMRVGIAEPAAVGLLYGAGVALAWLAVVMARLDVVSAWILMGLVLAIALFAGVLLALVPHTDAPASAPSRDPLSAFRHRG